MKIKSVSHIGITVSNFEDAVKWYHDHFGFKLISEQSLTESEVQDLYDLYQVKDSALKLGFLRGPKGQVVEIFDFTNKGQIENKKWHHPGPTHFTLDVKNVPKWHQVYKNKINFVTQPQVTDGTHWIFLKDPDGNLIELIDLKTNYFVIRVLGGLAGSIMKKTKFKKYYGE